MMNAAIDIGNTSCKIGFFENGNLRKVLKNIAIEEVHQHIIVENVTQLIISSVGPDIQDLAAQLKKFCGVLVLSSETNLPIRLNYNSPGTLGADRIAGAAGAFHLKPKNNSLVIDIGSCITYDVITEDGVYQGGLISPGVEMKLKAMNTFTARLPLVEKPEWTEIPGKTTTSSMSNGVLYGTLAEIEGIIARFSGIYRDMQVIICGGGMKFFESNIKHPIFACSELVLIGLNSILSHNDRN